MRDHLTVPPHALHDGAGGTYWRFVVDGETFGEPDPAGRNPDEREAGRAYFARLRAAPEIRLRIAGGGLIPTRSEAEAAINLAGIAGLRLERIEASVRQVCGETIHVIEARMRRGK